MAKTKKMKKLGKKLAKKNKNVTVTGLIGAGIGFGIGVIVGAETNKRNSMKECIECMCAEMYDAEEEAVTIDEF